MNNSLNTLADSNSQIWADQRIIIKLKGSIMAKSLPKILTNRLKAHNLISRFHQLNIKFQGWKDARTALKAYKARKA